MALSNRSRNERTSMKVGRPGAAFCAVACLLCIWPSDASAGDLIVDLGGSEGVSFVGVVRRWDDDGRLRVPIDPKAKIDAPRVDAQAQQQAGDRWAFQGLPAGRYDLVIFAAERVRVEG